MKQSVWLVSILMLLGSVGAMAADIVTVNLVAYRVSTDASGKERLDTTSTVKPGDFIEYRAIYRNASNNTVKDLAATLPVPGLGFEYAANTALPSAPLASLDGKIFSAAPTRVVTLANGSRETVAVPAAEYRYLRWNLGDLNAGASKSVSARMRFAPRTEATTASR
jgi:hypothetical protein